MNSNTKHDFYSHLQRSGSKSMNIDLTSHSIALDAAKDSLEFYNDMMEQKELKMNKSNITLADLLEVIHESVDLSSADELKRAVKIIIEVQAMDSGMRDCIRAAYLSGPIDDGDVPSKSGRDALLDSGYISKVVVKGEQGFNACTYKGSSAYKLIVAGA